MFIQSVNSFNSLKGNPLQRIVPQTAEAAQAAATKAAKDQRLQHLCTQVLDAAAKNGFKDHYIFQINPGMLPRESDKIALQNVKYILGLSD